MTKRTNDHELDLAEDLPSESRPSNTDQELDLAENDLPSESRPSKPKARKLSKIHSKKVKGVASDNENFGSDSEGSDICVEDCPSESDNLSSSDATSSDNECVPDPNESDSVGGVSVPDFTRKVTWKRVQPPEPPIDIKSKFTVSQVGVYNIPSSKKPIDFFNLFLTEELFIIMVNNTNIHARNKLEQDPMNVNLKCWCDVTFHEMKIFWSILINMGLSQRSDYKDYWSTDPCLFFPFFGTVMSLQRFESILSMFSLTNVEVTSESNSENDPLLEVETLLTSFNTAFKYFYVPDQEIRLDESLLISSKECHETEYIPKKYFMRYLTQGGIQKLEICDSSSGYVVHIGLRRFRSGNKGKQDLSKNIVFDLVNEAQLTGKGYHLLLKKTYMDFSLSQQLLSTNTFLTGPLDKSKCENLPHNIVFSQLKSNVSLYARYGDHLLIKYNIQKPACMTTAGWAEDQLITNAKSQQRVKSVVIRKYLRHMSGKDKSYLDVTCTIAIDSFWKKVAFNLVDMALFNSYILFKSQKGIKSRLSRQTFLEEIVDSLAFQKPIVHQPVGNYVDLGGGHKLVKAPIAAKRICGVCHRLEKKVKYICPGCDMFVHKKCFNHLKHSAEYKSSQVTTAHYSNDVSVGRSRSCTSMDDAGVVETIEIKVENDSD